MRVIYKLGVCVLIVSVLAVIVLAQSNQTTMTVRIINSAPTVESITFSPNPIDPGNTITIFANVTDPNSVPSDINTVNATIDMSTNATGDDVTLAMTYNSSSSLYEVNYTLSVNAVPGTWGVTVDADDNAVASDSNSSNFTVNSVVSIGLIDSPIDFGNASVGEEDRRADNSTAGSGYTGGSVRGFPLQLNNTGNVNADYDIQGTNLTGQTDNSYDIAVSNVEWNTENNATSATGLTTSDVSVATSQAPLATQDVYFWITLPSNIPEQNYEGNVTISATQS